MKVLYFFSLTLTVCSFAFGQSSAGPASKSDPTTEARARLAKGDLDGAILYYTKCIETNATKFHCYGERGDVYQKKYKLDLAIADYTKAIETAPDVTVASLKPSAPKPKYLTKRGEVYKRNVKGGYEGMKRDNDVALADFERALAIDPDFYDALIGAGKAWFFKDDRNKAAAMLDKATKLRPDLPQAFYEVGNIFYTIGTEPTFKQAFDYYSRAIKADPNFAEAYIARYMVQKYGNPDQNKYEAAARADISKFIALAPDSPRGYEIRGLDYSLSQQKYPEAIADFTKAIALDPTNWNYYSYRAEAYIAIKDHQKVVDDITKYLAMRKPTDVPTLAEWLPKRAEAYAELGQRVQATADYDALWGQDRDLKLRERRNVIASGRPAQPIQLTGNEAADYAKLIALIKGGTPIGEKNVSWVRQYESKNNIK